MSKASDTAQQVKDMADRLGWKIAHSTNGVVTITKNFTPGNMDEFIQADGEYFSILGLVPQTSPGSIWGTDGGGVGAISAHKNGFMRMNKSGCSKRVLNALNKIL